MATAPRKNRDERIDCRVNSESKQLFARAAKIAGLSVTAFMVEAARERATRVITEHERLVLNDQARDVFMDALSNPPAPNVKLRAAADKYATRD